jgi:DNA-binding ferritin-like protein
LNQQYIDPWGNLVDHMGYPIAPAPQGHTEVFSPAPGEMVIMHEQMIPIGQEYSGQMTMPKPIEKIAEALTQGVKAPIKGMVKPKSVKAKMKPEGTDPNLECLFDCMISMCAWLSELRTQAHLIHFNYSGSNFIPIHEFLKDRYEEHQEQFDAVGELLRSMGGMLPMCSEGLKEAICGCEFENCSSYNGVDMLMSYVKNVEAMGMMAKDLEQLAGCTRAIDVQDYATQLVGAAFKASWFIKASIGCGS